MQRRSTHRLRASWANVSRSISYSKKQHADLPRRMRGYFEDASSLSPMPIFVKVVSRSNPITRHFWTSVFATRVWHSIATSAVVLVPEESFHLNIMIWSLWGSTWFFGLLSSLIMAGRLLQFVHARDIRGDCFHQLLFIDDRSWTNLSEYNSPVLGQVHQ